MRQILLRQNLVLHAECFLFYLEEKTDLSRG